MTGGLDRGALLAALLADTVSPAEATRYPPRPGPVAGDVGPGVPLPRPARATQSLERSLRRRTSVREYDETPLDPARLAAVLAGADAQDALNWAEERAVGVELELLCAAWRVTSVDVGLYRFEAHTSTLVRLAALPTGDAVAELVLQPEFARTPAMVLVLGDLAAALRRHGSHGHRLLLNRAGGAAHAAWLAALGTGLDGAVFAGLLPGAIRGLSDIDGYHRAPLFAFSVGWPPKPSEPRIREAHREEVNHGVPQR